MNRIKQYAIYFIISIASLSQAQYLSSPKLSGVGLPFFRTGVFRSFSEDGENRIIKLYLKMMNDDLTFLKENDQFFAEVQYEIYVNDANKKTVFNRTVNERVETANFEETNSREIQNTFETDIEVPKGEYDAIITVLDKNSNKQVNRKIKFKIESIEGPEFLISDIMFFQKFDMDSSGRITSFEPMLQNNFSGDVKYIYFYFTTVVKNPKDSLEVQYKIFDPRKSIHLSNKHEVVNTARFNEHFIRLNREHFDQNHYELELVGKYMGNTMRTRKFFSFFWTTSPNSPKDLDVALEQMRYIVEADSIGWALKQPYEEQLGYFKRFWKRMDPNPDSEKNELLDEYFMRVNFATQHFSTVTVDGWKTDQGRIYIKFGAPDDIERYPFEMNTYPYEIWRYYNLRKIFLFQDRTGFGDYYLHPDYYHEEYN